MKFNQLKSVSKLYKSNVFKYVSVASVSLIILVVFQNCSKSGFSSSTADATAANDTQILAAGGCPFTGGAIKNGQRVWAYQNSGVPTGSQCVVEERACSNGVLSGSFNFRTCAVGAPMHLLDTGMIVGVRQHAGNDAALTGHAQS